MRPLPLPSRERLADLALLLALKAIAGLYLLHLGFSHVSDDDFARVVIAEQFAYAPRFDPSGTSWLPFPFWIYGGAMLLFGRSLATARAVAFGLGLLSIVPAYLALRAVGLSRWSTLAAVGLAQLTPWNAWLGVSTVPEAITGALVATGAIALGSARARPWGALALLAAALSRYEAWPVCAIFTATTTWSAGRALWDGKRRQALANVAAAALAASGPLAWMAWNAHAHGSATHFLARVARYRQAVGAAAVPLTEKIVGYPRALAGSAMPLLVLAALALPALVYAEVRQRWTVPLVALLAMMAFLIAGDLSDGAPTHHPERALVPAWWLLAGFGADGARALFGRFAWGRPGRGAWIAGALGACAVALTAGAVAAWHALPAQGATEQRAAQIARGRALRAVAEAVVEVTPCQFEHFALIAAMGAPERVVVRPATKEPATETCPRVVVGRAP